MVALAGILVVSGGKLFLNTTRTVPRLVPAAAETSAVTAGEPETSTLSGDSRSPAADTAGASTEGAAEAGESEATRAGEEALIGINSAPAARLCDLPGIGPVLASRIIEFRENNGPFRSIDDLVFVRGIGEKMLAKLRPAITLD